MKSKNIIKENLVYFDNSNALIHSSFSMNDSKCIHSINKICVENEILYKYTYDFNDYFTNNILIPYVLEFCKSRKIKCIDILPCINNSNLYILRIFDYWNNIVSIENITKRFAREIKRNIRDLIQNDANDIYVVNNYLPNLAGFISNFGLVILTISIVILFGLLLALGFVL